MYDYRYVVEDKLTGELYYKYYDLDFIESNNMRELLKKYRIISRDRFTGLKSYHSVPIYENDIAMVESNRRVPWGGPSSTYDKKYETRSVIRFKESTFVIDPNTPYNNRILELKGKEKDERDFDLWTNLYNYYFWNEYNREHNDHAYWKKIFIIGDIHKDMKLIA